MPSRIQRSRAKGWRMPPGAIYVGRPTIWGNPFPIAGEYIIWATVARGRVNCERNRRETAVELFRAWLTEEALPPARRTATNDRIVYQSGVAISTGEAAGIVLLTSAELQIPIATPLSQLHRLRGHDLACWCPLDQPCHADVLLALANRYA